MVAAFLSLFLAQIDTTYKLTDFRLPDAGATSIQLSVANWIYGYSGASYDTSYSSFYKGIDWTNVCRTTWDLELLGEYRFLDIWVSTDPHGNTPFRSPLFNLDWGRYNRISDDSVLYEDDGEIGYHLSPQLGTSIDGGLYLGQTPWFVYFSEACLVEWDVYDWEWEMGVHFSPDITGEVFIGGGFGKAREVTAAAKAWDFYDKLKVSANKDEIESLGELISTRWRYQLKHWYYPKYFYPDIETHLADCGIVERLEPYQTLRLREIVLGFPYNRLSGNRIRIGIGGTSEPWFYWFGSGWWWGVQSKIEGGYPLSRKWQVNWEGLGEILTQDFSSIEPSLRSGGELVYYLGDRFKTSAGIDAFYWSVFQPDLEYRVGVRLPLSLNLYIEDKVNITATLSYDIHGGEDRLNNFMSVFGKLWLKASIAWRLM